jgi:phospholipid/cholesterol/gamma-HCH transport system substrate-binding protein
MPSQQEVQWSQLKIGLIVLVASIILVTLLFLMTSSSGLAIFSRNLTVSTYFTNANGLKEGAAVDLEGVAIGSVKSIAVSTDPARRLTPVHVVMKLNGKYADQLKSDSKASLTTMGVLGDTVIDINSETATGAPLKDGDEIRTIETPSIGAMVKSGQGTVEEFNIILAKMNSIVDGLQAGKGTAGQLLTNPEMYNKLNAAVDELHTLEVNLNEGHGSAGKFFHDDAMYDKLNDTADKLDQIATSLQAGKGTAGKLLTDDTLYTNLNQTLTRTNALLAEVQEGKGTAAMLINDPKFAASVRDTVNQTNALITGVSQGRGTLGKLATDDQAYINLNSLLTESTVLVKTIRSDPKKYLQIQLKIF